jgi:hypothetical protein
MAHTAYRDAVDASDRPSVLTWPIPGEEKPGFSEGPSPYDSSLREAPIQAYGLRNSAADPLMQ